MLFLLSKITIRFRPKKFHFKPKLARRVNFFHNENFRSQFVYYTYLANEKQNLHFCIICTLTDNFRPIKIGKKIKTKYKQCGNPIIIQIEWISASAERRGKVCETPQTIFIGSDNYSVSANQSCVWATNTPKAKT